MRRTISLFCLVLFIPLFFGGVAFSVVDAHGDEVHTQPSSSLEEYFAQKAVHGDAPQYSLITRIFYAVTSAVNEMKTVVHYAALGEIPVKEVFKDIRSLF